MTTEGRTQPQRENPFAGNTFRSQGMNGVAQHLNDARVFAIRYVIAQAERVKLIGRNVLLFSMLAILALISVATFAVVAVVLFCVGLAGGIGALLGNRPWAGDLIVGLIVLGGAAAFSWLSVAKIRAISRRRTMADYLKPHSDV